MRLPWRRRVLVLLLPILAGCATRRDWREVRTGPATQAQVYDALDFLARTDGFSPSESQCDRGLGTWTSRWRFRQLGLGRPGRFRLMSELMLDQGSNETGWVVRFLVEQQIVKDLVKSRDPQEDDWSDDGQDVEREYLFSQRLARRLGSGEATGREPEGAPRGRE